MSRDKHFLLRCDAAEHAEIYWWSGIADQTASAWVRDAIARHVEYTKNQQEILDRARRRRLV